MPVRSESQQTRTESWRRSLLLLPLALLAVATFQLAAQQSRPTGAGLQVLTRVDQIRNLTPDEANLGYPVHLRAVVTYYGGTGFEFFVHDTTGGVYINDPDADFRVQAGQLVQVEGFTSSGGFAPEIISPKVTVLGNGPMPRPRPVTLEQLTSGREDSQWVEIEGVVRSAAEESGQSVLNLAAGGGRLKVRLTPGRTAGVRRLEDAKVLVQGAVGGIFNQNMQLLGAQLYVPSLDFVRVLEPPAHDPFSLPVRPIRMLLGFAPQAATGHRVKVQGTVTLFRPGRALFIEDGSGGLYTTTAQATPLTPGDQVKVAGFPAAGEYTPILEDAIFRKLGSGPAPKPVEIAAAQALAGGFDAHLVRLKARLLNSTAHATDPVLVFQSGTTVFDVQMRGASPATRFPKLEPGSQIQLTGICSVNVDDNRTPVSFRMLLRGPDDIVVLTRPPRWTLKHALWGLALMAALISAVLLWVFFLRRQVREQTATIREWLHREAALKEQYLELFENANDIVFTLDPSGRFASLNKAGERVSGYTRYEALNMTAAQMVAPEFVSVVQKLVAKGLGGETVPSVELEIVAKDGRRVWLEANLRPITRQGESVGLQSIARDITARRRAEEQLRMLSQAVEQSPSCVVITDPRTNIEYVNAAFTRVTGYTLDEVIGKNPRILKSGETPPEVYEELWKTITSGREWRGEFLNKKKSGELYWESASIQPVRDADGTIAHFMALKADITERKRAEGSQATQFAVTRVLAESSTLEAAVPRVLQTICENQRWDEGGFWILGDNNRLHCTGMWHGSSGAFEAFEAASLQTTFAPGEGMPGLVWKSREPSWVPDVTLDDQFIRGPVALREGLHAVCAFPLVFEDEVLGVVEFICGYVRPADEDFIRVMKDIGRQIGLFVRRVRAEAALRESNETLRSLIAASPVAIMTVNPAGEVLMWNPAAQEIFGWKEEEVLGQFLPIVPKVKHEEFRCLRERALNGDAFMGVEVQRQRKDGTLIDVSVSTAPIRGAQGNVTSIMAVMVDITERKRAEEALRTSEERSRIVAASISDLIYEWDLKDKVDWYGDVDTLMGYPAGGFPRTLNGWAAALHPEDKERVWVAVENQLKGVAPYDVRRIPHSRKGRRVAMVVGARQRAQRRAGSTSQLDRCRNRHHRAEAGRGDPA